jgi:hypothetical protein
MAAALQVTDTFVHEYPTVQPGGFVFTDTHVGAWLLNTGSAAIRYAAAKVAVIGLPVVQRAPRDDWGGDKPGRRSEVHQADG